MSAFIYCLNFKLDWTQRQCKSSKFKYIFKAANESISLFFVVSGRQRTSSPVSAFTEASPLDITSIWPWSPAEWVVRTSLLSLSLYHSFFTSFLRSFVDGCSSSSGNGQRKGTRKGTQRGGEATTGSTRKKTNKPIYLFPFMPLYFLTENWCYCKA